MVCPKCRKTVPDESVFCLSCGTRLARPERLAPGNGGGKTPPAAPAPARPSVPPGAKQAYALAFRPLVDERLRYRIARWVCEVAPAHQLAEVQEGLLRGDFATFLALTAEEARAAQQRIQTLGVHPGSVRLALATEAEMLLPTRVATRTGDGNAWTPVQKFVAVLIGLAVLFVFGGAASYFYFKSSPSLIDTLPTTAPTIGGTP